MSLLELDDYRSAINLDRPFTPAVLPAAPDRFDALTRTALRLLADEASATPLGLSHERIDTMPIIDAHHVFRALLNLRPPDPIPPEAEDVVDALLAGRRQTQTTHAPYDVPAVRPDTPLALWQGDLTDLAADAIVNAANNAMLGCFQPLHACIDNAIHSAAGPALRRDCHRIMTAQGVPEPTGAAKITRGYHLPARFVIHTVGPIVRGPVRADHRNTLAESYTACLDLAAAVDSIRTIAFCSISTGVFGYPKEDAARTAVRAIETWLAAHPGRFDRVICCAFTDDDAAAYRDAIHQGKQ